MNDHLGNKINLLFLYPSNKPSTKTVIYLHGNAGNLLEGASKIDSICGIGYNLLSYDASACGNSEGDYLTLGYREANDISLIIDHII